MAQLKIARAQSDRGAITGTVMDPVSAVIPSATVIATNAESGSKYETVTTATGNYSVPQVPAGTYDLMTVGLGVGTIRRPNDFTIGTQNVKRDLRPLFDPKSVAILGASATPAKWGNWLARAALSGERRRPVFLVNRSGREILGRPSFRSLSELPVQAEMVVIAIGAAGFENAVSDALGAGAKAIVAITSGLGEMGEGGLAIEARVAARVRAAGAILIGPNCLGVADTGTDLLVAYGEFAATWTFDPPPPQL